MSSNPFTFDPPPHQMPSPPPGQGSSPIKILLIVLGIIGLLGVLMCAGVGALMYVGMQQIRQQLESMEITTGDEEVLTDAIKDAPEVQAELGDITSVKYDLQRTGLNTTPEDNHYWYSVTGTKGHASLVVEESDDESEWYKSAKLVMEDGREVPLTLAPIPYRADDYDSQEVYRLVRNDPRLKETIGRLTMIEYAEPSADEPPAEGTEELTVDPVPFLLTGEQGTAVAKITFAEDGSAAMAVFELPDGTTWEFVGTAEPSVTE